MNSKKVIISLLPLWLFTSALYNGNWMYRSVFIASMVVCLLGLWVGKRKFGIEKILYVKAYIFAGWLVVSLAIAQIVGWNDLLAISKGSLFGIVGGLIWYSKESWIYILSVNTDDSKGGNGDSIGPVGKHKLVIQVYQLLALNMVSYICLAFSAKITVFYGHTSSTLIDYNILLSVLATITLALLILMSVLYLNTKAPYPSSYDTLKTGVKVDVYLRFSVIVLTFYLLNEIVNINNVINLYFFIGISFCINCFLEIFIIQKTIKMEINKKD